MGKPRTITRSSPARVLIIGFIVMISVGTFAFMLPGATEGGMSFTDALFTATSSVCVTGLIVKDTSVDFTLAGKLVILFLIQAGGLGYMSLATLVALLFGRKIGITERLIIKETLNIHTLEGIVAFIKRLLIFVAALEATGAVVLALLFSADYPASKAAFLGLFHSVSAFNNAGFSLFGASLNAYRGDLTVNITVMGLIIVGGTGFLAWADLYDSLLRERRKPMLHTQAVLFFTAILIISGTLGVLVSEWGHYFRILGLSKGNAFLCSLFSSVTARTAGFTTLPYSLLQPSTLFLTIMLMVVGASPGGTGGGIKTTTFAVVLSSLWCGFRGKKDTVLLSRRVPENIVSRSFDIMALAVIYISLATLAISFLEKIQYGRALFETVSAFATVGLSTGDGGTRSLSALFSDQSKIIVVLTMIVGRLGPLTLFSALLQGKEEEFRYPEGRIIIG